GKVENTLELINQLQPVYYYQYKNHFDEEGRLVVEEEVEGDRQVGLLAQDVELVIPEIVCYPFGWEQGKGSLGLAYERLTVILIKAAQEQQQIIDTQQQQINSIMQFIGMN
ncbi:tail fiber domain-containing protein, partial [PVC group bacterium]|nr:tail fiber domain-containing protein [PVC group bacterium]